MSLSTKLHGLRQIYRFDNRWSLLINRGLFREPLNVYRMGDLEFIEDHRLGDANGAREVLTSSMYARFLPALHHRSRKKTWRVADLGASNGGFPLLLHLNGFAMQCIVSVEMNPRIFPRLRFNLEHNLAAFATSGSRPEIEVHNVAIGGTSGVVEISTADGTGGSIYADNPAHSATERAKVPLRTLDDVLRDRQFDLVKIDIEGAEYEVFASPSHGALKRCRWVIMEVHRRPGRAQEEIFVGMDRLGFALLSKTEDIHAEGATVCCFERTGESWRSP